MRDTCLYDFEMGVLTTMQLLVVGVKVQLLMLGHDQMDHDAYVLGEHFKERRHILERNVMIPRITTRFQLLAIPILIHQFLCVLMIQGSRL